MTGVELSPKRNKTLLVALTAGLALCIGGLAIAFAGSFSSWKAGPRLGQELYSRNGELLGFGGEAGTVLAVTDISRKVSVWEAASGEHLADYDRPSPGYPLSFRPDGEALVVTASGSLKTLVVLEVQTGAELQNFEALQYYAPIYSPVLNADGSRIHGLRADGSLVRIETGEFEEMEAGVRVAANSGPLGKHVPPTREIEEGLEAAGLGINPFNPRYKLSVSISHSLVGTCDYTNDTTDTLYALDAEVELLDLKTGESLGQQPFKSDGLPKCSPVKPANWGDNIQTGRLSQKIYPWAAGILAGRPAAVIPGLSLTALPELQSLDEEEEVAYGSLRIALSADERYLFIPVNNRALLWDLTTGEFLREVKYGSVFTPTPDGLSYLATGEAEDSIFLYDTASGQEKLRFTGDLGPIVSSAVFSADGKYLVTTGYQGSIVWDALGGKELFRVGEGKFQDRAFFSQDNRWLASGDFLDFSVWELENMAE